MIDGSASGGDGARARARRLGAGFDFRAVFRFAARAGFVFRAAARFFRGAAFLALAFFFRFFAIDVLLMTDVSGAPRAAILPE